MKKQIGSIFNSNWFFLSLILFVIVLPLSQALVSVLSGIILLTALIEDSWRNKIRRIKNKKLIFFIPAIFLIYILSTLLSGQVSNSFYDLQKTLFYLVIPLAFIVGKEITDIQKRYLLYVFSLSIFVSTIIAFVNWKLKPGSQGAFSIHAVTLVSHIRFSFQLILIFWFYILMVQTNFKKVNSKKILHFLFLAFYFLFFLFFQQSLTGIIAFAGSLVFFIFFSIFRVRLVKYRISLLIFAILSVIVPVVYIYSCVKSFYNIEEVDKDSLDAKTKQGNYYTNDFNNPLVENGKYVYLYVCEPELREEWNKISEIKYDSIGNNGFEIKATLVRYLTSKGLRKDAEGIGLLNEDDVKNIEDGIANVIYQSERLSLYPRIYQTIWEYYTYSKTGNANQKSFSQRIEFSKAALTIIKQNFWFGVGTGNWEDEFAKAYKQNQSTLSESLYGSAHNQYLNYMVKFGFIGFLAIMFFFAYPVVKSGRYRDHLFMLFLVFMFFANFGDSNLESHMGSSFFIFFYCIFIIGGTNYLELPWQEQR